MRQRGVIFLDVDGVLMEWFKPFIAYCNQRGIDLRFDNLEGYNIETLDCWEKPSQCFQFIGDFAKTKEWENLPLLTPPGAVHMLHNLGFSVRVLSQVSNLAAQARRAAALTMRFGPVFDGIHFTTHKESKAQYILRFMREWADHYDEWPQVYMLDDKPSLITELANIRANREGNGYGSYIHPIGINNRADHPYLTPHMEAVKATFKDDVTVLSCVTEFASTLTVETLRGEFSG